MPVKLKISLISLLVLMSFTLALPFALRDRREPVTVAFAGYTNEPTGLYTFAAFRLANQTRHDLACVQESLEIKSPQGWIQDNDHTGYQHGGLQPGENRVITLLSPTTNGIWRANFQFQCVSMRPLWWHRIRAAFGRRGIHWHDKSKTYSVRTAEIGN